MALTPEQAQAWDLARAIARVVQADPCGGLPEHEVQESVGCWEHKVFKQSVFLAWRKGWVHFGAKPAAFYLLAPPDDDPARFVARPGPPEPETDPFAARRMIEVRLGEAVFTVVTCGGTVEDVAGDHGEWQHLAGMGEGDAAGKLKAEGATFAEVTL